MESDNQGSHPGHQGQSGSSGYDPLYHILSGQDTPVPNQPSPQHALGSAFPADSAHTNFPYWEPHQQHQLPAFRTVANYALGTPWDQTNGGFPAIVPSPSVDNLMFQSFSGGSGHYVRGLSGQPLMSPGQDHGMRHQNMNLGFAPPLSHHEPIPLQGSSATMDPSQSASRSHPQANNSQRAAASTSSRAQQRIARTHNLASSRSSAPRGALFPSMSSRTQERARRSVGDLRGLRTFQQAWAQNPELRRRISRELAFFNGSAKKYVVASASAKRSLQSVDINDLPENDRCCPICYSDYNVRTPEGIVEAPLRLPKCGHVFGDHCLKKWLSDSSVCPYCRDQLPSEEKIEKPSVREFLERLRSGGLIDETSTGTSASADELLADIMDAHDESEMYDTEVNMQMPTPPSSASRPGAGSRPSESTQGSPTRMRRPQNPTNTSGEIHVEVRDRNSRPPPSVPASRVPQAPSRPPHQSIPPRGTSGERRRGRTTGNIPYGGGTEVHPASRIPVSGEAAQPLPAADGSRSRHRPPARRSASPATNLLQNSTGIGQSSTETFSHGLGYPPFTMTAHQGQPGAVYASPGVTSSYLNASQHSGV